MYSILGAGTASGIDLCPQPWDQHPRRSLSERTSLHLAGQTVLALQLMVHMPTGNLSLDTAHVLAALGLHRKPM